MSNFNDQAVYQFIGNVARSSNATIATLPAGAIGIFDVDGAVKTDAMTTGTFRVVQRKANGDLLFSPWFNYTELYSKKQAAYTPDKNQVTYVGTNTSGTVTGLGSTASSLYNIKVGLKGWGSVQSSEFIKEISYATAASGDTVATVAAGLFDSAQRTFKANNPIQPIIAERITDTASVAAFTGTAVLYKLTKDSTVVSTYVKDADGTVGITASTASITAANVVSIASTNGRSFTFSANILGSGAGHHAIYIGETSYLVADAGSASQNGDAIVTAINAGTQAIASNSSGTVTISYRNDVYLAPPMVLYSADDSTWANLAVTMTVGESKPVSYLAAATTSSAATFTLDKPWQGETCYLYEGTGTTTTASIGVATLTTGYWGMKFSAKPQAFDPINDSTLPVRFSVYVTTGTGFFATTVAPLYTQGDTPGSGTYKMIAAQEIQTQWQNKVSTNIQAYPRTVYKTEAGVNYVYNLTTLVVKKALNTTLIGAQPATYMTIEIATSTSALATDYATLTTVFGL